MVKLKPTGMDKLVNPGVQESDCACVSAVTGDNIIHTIDACYVRRGEGQVTKFATGRR